MSDPELVWSASLDQLKSGYIEDEECYTCLCCGKRFEKGIIYPEDGVLYEAGRFTRLHIEKEHGSVFEHLIGLDKSVTGLSEVQKRLLALFYQGKSDAEIQKQLSIGSASTIRNHRFLLRERERQARILLAIMELLRAGEKRSPAKGSPAPAGSGSDRSEARTGDEDRVIARCFPYGTEGPLKALPNREKQRLTVLSQIARRFEGGKAYTEEDVNAILEAVFTDYVLLRRLLVDHGFLARLPDGSRYWRNESSQEPEESTMDRKQELKRLAKETKTDAGVFQVRNTQNGKVWVKSTRDLKTINGQRFGLELGSHINKELQKEWSQYGKDAFTFEVLEVLEKKETGYFDLKDELKKLEEKWLERLQPYGDRGYNSLKDDE